LLLTDRKVKLQVFHLTAELNNEQMNQKPALIYKIIPVLSFLLSTFLYVETPAQNITDAEKKAILIYKFIENVNWENEGEFERFNIGVLSDDDLLYSELMILETVKIRNKNISLIHFNYIDEIKKTQVLVVAKNKNLVAEQILKKTKGSHTLLITDNCRKNDVIMINFIYSKDKMIDFEINKANILMEKISIKPDLLLLGGTEIDIAELYNESQAALRDVRQKVSSLEIEMEGQQEEINKRTKEIARIKEDANIQKAKLKEQEKEISEKLYIISDQEKELASISEKINEQNQIMTSRLENLQLKEEEIEKSNKILEDLNKEITEKQEEIENQKSELSTYESTVEGQKTLIYLVASFSFLLLIIAFITFRNFRIKKKAAKKLADKEAEIRMLFNVAPLPVVMTNLESGKAIYVNQQGVELFKLDPETALEQISEDYYVYPEQRKELTDKLKKDGKVDDFEVLFKNAKEEQFYGSLSGLITKNEGKLVFFVAIKNITEIKNIVTELNQYKSQLEALVEERTKELIDSQNRFKDLAELLPETIFEMDFAGDILFVNNSGMRSFGLTEKDFEKGINLYDVVSDMDRNKAKNRFEKLCSGDKVQTEEFLFKRKDNTYFPGIIYMNCAKDTGDLDIARGIVVDITERKNIERKIVNTIIETEEKERKRVAEDLHDGLGSLLSGLNLYIDMIDNPDLDETEKAKLFKSIRSIIDESIKNSKEISNNLRPSTLSRFGLVGSLQTFCDKINETKKTTIDFNHKDFNLKLDNNTETALYRIVNELINNTIKYASAENIKIQLGNEDQKLVLIYEDDGLGFDKKIALKSGGMGLKNIITRIDSVGGTIKMDSEVGKGINVLINIETNN